MICVNQTTFYTASVFWGTLGPRRVFGAGSRYWTLLIGFPVGVAAVLGVWVLQKLWPRSRTLRSIHVVAIMGGAFWFPYTIATNWTYVVSTAVSWVWLKSKHLAFWSRYNFVFATALSAGVAISGIVQFLALTWAPNEGRIDWWGNNADVGCNRRYACKRFQIPGKGYFGADPGTFN